VPKGAARYTLPTEDGEVIESGLTLIEVDALIRKHGAKKAT
jgi:hypothetical protein